LPINIKYKKVSERLLMSESMRPVWLKLRVKVPPRKAIGVAINKARIVTEFLEAPAQ